MYIWNKHKPDFVKKKYWILDFSFYVYNGTFAARKRCKCYNEEAKTWNRECSTCEGTGWVHHFTKEGFINGGLNYVMDQIVQRTREGYQVVLAFDPPKTVLERTQWLPTYKGNRGDKPAYITAQMDLGEEIIPHLSTVQCYTSDISESDDVMACLALKFAREGHDVVVATDDKDLLPLLSQRNIVIFRQHNFFTRRMFIEKFGFEPARFNEYLALVGDAADNFNLIKGIGPKAATVLIEQLESITQIWNNWNGIDPKYRKRFLKSCDGTNCGKKCKKSECENFSNKIEHMRDELELSLKIATLNEAAKCIPIETKQISNDGLVEILKKYEFNQAVRNLDLLHKEVV